MGLLAIIFCSRSHPGAPRSKITCGSGAGVDVGVCDGLGVRVGIISVGAEVKLGKGVSEAGVVVRSTKVRACSSTEEPQHTNIPPRKMMAAPGLHKSFDEH